MTELLEPIGLYLDVTRVAMAETVAAAILTCHTEIGIENTPDRLVFFVQIMMATINITCRSDY